MEMSSVEELSELFPALNDQGLTWEIFGTLAQSDIDNLKNVWFPHETVSKTKLQNIWDRHPIHIRGI